MRDDSVLKALERLIEEARREIANAPKESKKAAYHQGVLDICRSLTAAIEDGLIR